MILLVQLEASSASSRSIVPLKQQLITLVLYCKYSFSFIIPTYNAGHHLERCLKSIRGQDYDQGKVEILILDADSTDNTLDIASRFNCRVLKNPRKLAEYGVQLGVVNSTGELIVDFAADNEVIGNDWLKKVAALFGADAELCAVWGRIASGKDDPGLNKYFALIQSDPLSWFLNKNLGKYKRENHAKGNLFTFRVDSRRPLVWGANGLVYRSEKLKPIWMRQQAYFGDNDAFQLMIEGGDNKVAYFDEPFVYHHHVARLRDSVKKWRRNLKHHLFDNQETRNMNWAFTEDFNRRALLWGAYSLIPVFSLSHSCWLALKDKDMHWFYHPLVSFLQGIVYLYMVLSENNGRRLIGRLLFKQRSV